MSVAEEQLQEIISSPDAWSISEESGDPEEGIQEDDLKPTTSARQVRALIDQVTGKSSIMLNSTSLTDRSVLAPAFAQIPPSVPDLYPASDPCLVPLSNKRVIGRV